MKKHMTTEGEMEVEVSEGESSQSTSEEQQTSTSSKKSKGGDGETKDKKKESKPGIIYLSVIPPKMNVSQIREYFSQFGEIHRSFLQPDEKAKQKSRKNQVFTEGWIEFKKRRHAKRVAAMLNNTPLGGKKKKQNYDFLWNIKYLPGLRWVHINERLAYERISRQQRMRAEIAAAKRETSFFAKSVSLKKKIEKGKKKGTVEEDSPQAELPEFSIPGSSPSPQTSQESTSSSNTSSGKEISSDRLKLFQMFFQQEQAS